MIEECKLVKDTHALVINSQILRKLVVCYFPCFIHMYINKYDLDYEYNKKYYELNGFTKRVCKWLIKTIALLPLV